MRRLLVRYLVWVLLPVAGALLTGQLYLQGKAQERRLDSASRLGGLAAALLRAEMGAATSELVRRAPVLQDPHSAGSVGEAALRGDTVLGLGAGPSGPTLTVALAEPDPDAPQGAGSPLRLRAITEPFRPRALPLLHHRAGYPVALYLRDGRIQAEPSDFGPESLPARDARRTSDAPRVLPLADDEAVLLPLDPSNPTGSPVSLLVGPPPPRLPGAPRSPSGGFVLLSVAVGLASLSLVKRGGSAGTLSPVALLLPPALPLAALWLSLLGWSEAAAFSAAELEKSEMIRVLALLGESGERVSDPEVAGSTGFDVTRRGEAGSLSSTLPPGPLLTAVEALPMPSPTFPSTGVLDEEGERAAYASSLEGDGSVAILTASGERNSHTVVRIVMVALGLATTGLASGFLLRTPLLPGPAGFLILRHPEPGPGPGPEA